MRIGKQYKNGLFETKEEAKINGTVDYSDADRKLQSTPAWQAGVEGTIKKMGLENKPLIERAKELKAAKEKNKHGEGISGLYEVKQAQNLIIKKMGLNVKDVNRGR